MAAQSPSRLTPALSQWHHTVWSYEAAGFAPIGTSMVRSPDGYLWLGAGRAIARFDGVRFTIFDSTNTPAFRHADATTMVPSFVDRDGVMWVRGDRRATFTYDGRGFALRSSVDPKIEIRPPDYVAKSLIQDGSGRIWWADRRLITFKGGQVSPPELPPGVPDTGIVKIVRDTGRGLWIGTATQGVWHVDASGARHYPFAFGRILPELQSSDGTLWAYALDGRPQLLRLVHGRWASVALPDSSSAGPALLVQSVVEAPDQSVWIATRGRGVLRWRDGTLEQHDPSNGLSSANVQAIWIGEDGVVWLTTDVGLERLRPTWFSRLDRGVGLSFVAGARFAFDHEGGMWIESAADRALYRLHGGVVHGVDGPPVVRTYRPTNGTSYSLLGAARSGGMWIAPWVDGGGLIHVQANGTSRRVPSTAGLSPQRFGLGIEASDGVLWLRAGRGEFGRLKDGRYERLSLFGREFPRMGAMIEDGRGRIWLSHEQRDEVAIVSSDTVIERLGKTGVPDGIYDMALEGGDTVWMHSAGTLIRSIGERTRVVPTSGADRFLIRASHLAVGGGNVWLYNRFGLMRLPLAALHRAADNGRDTVSALPVNALDGVRVPQAPSRVVNPMVKAPDGRLWIATPDGYVVSNHSAAPSRAIAPIAHVEEVTADGLPIDMRRSPRIPPTPDRVSFRYTATSLSLPERVHIEYRLEGADRTWVNGSGLERVATYTQLRPGSYRFHVRAWNTDDATDTTLAMIDVRVMRAWYQSYWFYAACAVLLATMSYLVALTVSRNRNRREAERAQQRFTAVLDERSRIARELHDTLLQGFTGITLHLETVRGQLAQRSDPSAASLAEILQYADGTLREAREMVWDIRAPELDRGLIHAIAAEAHRVMQGDQVRLDFRTAGHERRLAPALETTLLRIAREAVMNAVKHADPQSITIMLAFEDRQVTLTITDDGRGAEPERVEQARPSGHWGLTGMRERATRAGGRFHIRTAPGQGMSVSAELPTE